jgi:hypothetical protein
MKLISKAGLTSLRDPFTGVQIGLRAFLYGLRTLLLEANQFCQIGPAVFG